MLLAVLNVLLVFPLSAVPTPAGFKHGRARHGYGTTPSGLSGIYSASEEFRSERIRSPEPGLVVLRAEKRRGGREDRSARCIKIGRDWFQGSEPPRQPGYLLNNRFSCGQTVARGRCENRWRIGRHKSLSVWHTRYTGPYVGPMGLPLSLSLFLWPLPGACAFFRPFSISLAVSVAPC